MRTEELDFFNASANGPGTMLEETYGLTGEDALSAWVGFTDYWNDNWRGWKRVTESEQ